MKLQNYIHKKEMDVQFLTNQEIFIFLMFLSTSIYVSNFFFLLGHSFFFFFLLGYTLLGILPSIFFFFLNEGLFPEDGKTECHYTLLGGVELECHSVYYVQFRVPHFKRYTDQEVNEKKHLEVRY